MPAALDAARRSARRAAAGVSGDLGLEAWLVVLGVLGWAVWRGARAAREVQHGGASPLRAGSRVRWRDGRNGWRPLRRAQRSVVVRFVDTTTCARGHPAELRVIVTTVRGSRPVRTVHCPTCDHPRCSWCAAPVPAGAARCACRGRD